MAKRLISAAIAVPLGILVLWIDNTYLFVTVFAAFSAVAVYELLLATKYLRNKAIAAVSLSYALALPYLFCVPILKKYVIPISFCFMIALFCIMLKMHEKVRFDEVALVAFVSIGVPLALSSCVFIRMKFVDHGLFYLVFTLLSTWIGDAGAYFVGTFLGKHKMAPTISPKKSWEGFVGGLLTSAVFGLGMGLIYPYWLEFFTGVKSTFTVNVPYLLIVSVFVSMLGVLGDLTASIVKRQCSVKDFGNFLPGHGGVLDRFDSVLFAAPFVYILFQILEPITGAL